MNRSFASLRLWFRVACLAVSTLTRAAEPAAETIDAGEPRARVRAEILQETKLGASPEEVLKFIASHLQPKTGELAPKLLDHPALGSTAQNSERKGVRSIRLVLGHYTANPALLLMEIPMVVKTTTSVQWAFDKEDKLIEVFVDKDAELGDGKGPN